MSRPAPPLLDSFLSALGTDLGPELEPVLAEEEEQQEEEAEYEQGNEWAGSDYQYEYEDNSVSEVRPPSLNFSCPGPGFHASPTRCQDYYQCTEDLKVGRIGRLARCNACLPSPSCSTARTACTTIRRSLAVTGRPQWTVRRQFGPSSPGGYRAGRNSVRLDRTKKVRRLLCWS